MFQPSNAKTVFGDADLQDPFSNNAQTGPAPAIARPQRESGVSGYGLNVLPPLSAVVELAAIVALILAVDWAWPALDINNLQPSPYWLPVLLLSLQYGTASGSLAVIVAIGAYFAFITLPEQGVGENEFAYRLRILAQPILWIATAVMLGQFRMVQISAKRELVRRVAELESQGRTLADYANRLRGRCDDLERHIASHEIAADARLLATLGELRSAPAIIPAAIEQCLAAAFPGAAASVFVRQGPGLQKLASSRWPADARWLAGLPAGHPLTLAVVGSKRRLNVLHDGDESVLSGQGLAAVAVVEPRTGRVLGLLKIEDAPARFVTEELLAQLDVVAAAIAPGLEDPSGADRLKRQSDGEPVSGAIPLRQASRLGAVTVIETALDNTQPDMVRPKVGH